VIQMFRHLREHVGMAESWAGEHRVKVNVVLAGHSYAVSVEHTDLEELRTLLTRRMDILLRLLENPSLHEHESFAEFAACGLPSYGRTVLEGGLS